jgi:hypothetical protein
MLETESGAVCLKVVMCSSREGQEISHFICSIPHKLQL